MKVNALLATVLLALAALSGCGQNADTRQDEKSITVKDMNGREVVITTPVSRAVAVTAANCEIIYALGAEDALVGRGEFCDYPPQALEIPQVQSGENLNIEQVLALEPDVVFMSTMAQTDEQISSLEATGIAVVMIDAEDIEGVYESITLIGDVMGREAEADALVTDMLTRFSDLEHKADLLDQDISVYFEVSPLEYGLWTAGKGTFMDEIAGMLGLENIFSDVSSWVEVSQEQVIQRNPDYILSVAMYFGEGPLPQDEIMSRNGWQDITAVANKNVYFVDTDEFSRPGPRLADAAENLFALIYGQE